MTNLQAFIRLVGKEISEEDASALLEFDGIDPNAEWDPSDQSMKCALYGTALNYMDQDGIGVTQVSEGGYSISYDRGKKEKYMERLANDSGCKDLISKYRTTPVLKSIGNRW